jgi:hypothetical protein
MDAKEELIHYINVVEIPPLGTAAETPENNPNFFAKWAKGEHEEFTNIEVKDVVKIIFYSDSQNPTFEPNRAIVVYKDCSILILTLAYGERKYVAEVVTHAEQIDQATLTKEEVAELKI